MVDMFGKVWVRKHAHFLLAIYCRNIIRNEATLEDSEH